MLKVLFVEDDEAVRRTYASLLSHAGFDVVAVDNSAAALESFDMSPPNIALLDIAFDNDVDAGFHLCAELRSRSKTLPIIFLTSLDSDFDKISGMRVGADDYLTKDINADYLIVRIKALLRRVEVLTNQKQQTENVLERGDLLLNMDTLTVSWKDTLVDLSLTQLWMVHALACNVGFIRTPEQLMEASNINVQPNTLTSHITHIRKKFQTIDEDFSAIKTERGVGYRWVNK